MGVAARALDAIRRPAVLRYLAYASLAVNIGIVVTGGAVRLTASGLGCPTWPSCTDDSLVPTPETSEHGVIEFGNRLLTFVVTAVAIATLVAALAQRRRDGRAGQVRARLALAIFLGIPAQAVLGGLTVLTGLNPWLVGAHFLLSMVLIAFAVLLIEATRTGPPRLPRRTGAAYAAHAARRWIAGLTVAAAAAVLVLGTIVTGSGPHAGATDDEGVAHRTGLDPAGMSQAHADAVMVLIGLTIGLVALSHVRPAPPGAARAAWILLAAELAQGALGYVQYFLHLPVLLVGLHMLGAGLVWVAALRAWLIAAPAAAGSAEQHRDGVDEQAHQRADDRAVDPDELKVPADL